MMRNYVRVVSVRDIEIDSYDVEKLLEIVSLIENDLKFTSTHAFVLKELCTKFEHGEEKFPKKNDSR